jgi:hypothetical protein
MLAGTDSQNDGQSCDHPPTTFRRRVVFSLVPIVVFLLVTELGIRCVYYQRKSGHLFAIEHGLSIMPAGVARWRARCAAERDLTALGALGVSRDESETALYTEVGAPLLADFQERYATEFRKLVASVESTGAKLIVLYIPSGDYRVRWRTRHSICRAFFRNLAEEHHLIWVDVTDRFDRHSRGVSTPMRHGRFAFTVDPPLSRRRPQAD